MSIPPEDSSFKKPTLKRPLCDESINLKRRNVSGNLSGNPPNRLAKVSTNAAVLTNLDSQVSWLNAMPGTNVASWTHDRVLRERNKCARQIYTEEGFEYGKDVSAAELKSRISSAVKLRQASVAKLFKILNASRNVQLCFLVDVTGSMTRSIYAVCHSIYKIVERLTVAGPGAIAKEVSLAFVGYRDFGYENQFELLPFTNNVEDFRQFCNSIHTSEKPIIGARGDMPEDVFGGLETAIWDLSWSDSMCTKIIFHIADYPGHGEMYHNDNYYDNFPDGDPEGRTAESLFKALREKGIQYHFGKLTHWTDKMIELFSEALGSEIEVYDIRDVEKLLNCVVSSVSIGMSMHPSMRAKQHFIKTDKIIPNWSEVPISKGVFLSYEMPETVIEVTSGVPMTQQNPAKAKIQVANNPFAHGSERKVFYGRDLSSNLAIDIVLKEYIKNNTETVSRGTVVPYEIATQMQTIAAYLSSVFSDYVKEKAGNLQEGLCIKFLKSQLLSIEIKPGENRYMSCERRYGPSSEFLRFSNNADYEMLDVTCQVKGLNFEVVELLMAFSHWTYQISGGYLMVVDLQGVLSKDESGRRILELTDPAIHCTDLTRFGRTNLGEEGIKIFFARHKCNRFCQAMELEEQKSTTL